MPTLDPAEVVYLYGEVVREAVRDKGWDLARLAVAANIPPGTIRNITRAEKPDCTRRSRAERIAKALKKPAREIIRPAEAFPAASEVPKRAAGRAA